jgi:uncharacterized protein (TIGR03086 family)
VVNTDMTDLSPACQRTADVLARVTDEQLNQPTPCEKLRLDELIAHVGMLAQAFTAAARKDFGPLTDTPPTDGAEIDDDWRASYPQRLEELASAWKDPEAWQGMTRAGGVELPAEVMGSVALAEVVIHGWDVARGGRALRMRPDHHSRLPCAPRAIRRGRHRGNVRGGGADR